MRTGNRYPIRRRGLSSWMRRRRPRQRGHAAFPPQDSSMELGGTLEFRDVLRFQYSQCFRRTWWFVLLTTVVSFAGVLLAVVAVVLTSDLDMARRNGTPLLLAFLFWIVIVTTPYRAAKRQMKTNIPLSAPIQYIFSSSAIEGSGSHFSSELSYEALWKITETKSLFLLYLGEGSALVLPKRFFKDGTQEHDWRTFVEQRISPKHITKSGFLGRWL